jgi:hypothetical protein
VISFPLPLGDILEPRKFGTIQYERLPPHVLKLEQQSYYLKKIATVGNVKLFLVCLIICGDSWMYSYPSEFNIDI